MGAIVKRKHTVVQSIQEAFMTFFAQLLINLRKMAKTHTLNQVVFKFVLSVVWIRSSEI
jgi:hypothetical protein